MSISWTMARSISCLHCAITPANVLDVVGSPELIAYGTSFTDQGLSFEER